MFDAHACSRYSLLFICRCIISAESLLELSSPRTPSLHHLRICFFRSCSLHLLRIKNSASCLLLVATRTPLHRTLHTFQRLSLFFLDICFLSQVTMLPSFSPCLPLFFPLILSFPNSLPMVLTLSFTIPRQCERDREDECNGEAHHDTLLRSKARHARFSELDAQSGGFEVRT